MSRLAWIPLCLLLSPGPAPAGPPRQEPAEGKSADEKAPEVANATPEEAFRTFVLAVMLKDEKTLRAVTLPHDEFEWLLKGVSAPEDQRENLKAMVSEIKIRALKPGDEITVLPGRKMTITEEDVDDEHAVLLPEGPSIPTRCRKVDGRWRVDATAVIAGRKAADAARKRDQKK